MPVTFTQFLAPTSPDGIGCVVEVGGYLISTREDLPTATGHQREWSAFDIGSGTARQFKGLGSSGSSSAVSTAWAYGGYAWVVQAGQLIRMDPTDGGTARFNLADGTSATSRGVLIGSTAYVLYATGRFISVNMATQTSSLINSNIGVTPSTTMLYASDGYLYFCTTGNLYRLTLGGTATLVATIPSSTKGFYANIVELSGHLYFTANDGWIKVDMATFTPEVFMASSLGAQIREVGGRLHSIISNGFIMHALDPNTGLQQSQTLTGIASGSGPAYLFQRSTGQLWVVTDQPSTYP